jgi:hypothetical protein
MKFLDLNGLNHLLTKIKASFSTAIVKSSQNQNIPFVANHQIVNLDAAGNINVYNWFQKASKGGILEIVTTGLMLVTYTYCKDSDDTSYLYKLNGTSNGPVFENLKSFITGNYTHLIKIDNDKLLIAKT